MNALTSATILYNVDGGTNLTYSWTGNLVSNASETITLPNMTVSAGPHVFNASSSNPNGTADTNPANDASLVNFNATIGGQAASLTISTDCWGIRNVLGNCKCRINYSCRFWWKFNRNCSWWLHKPPEQVMLELMEMRAVITENLCLAYGCYDIIMYDDWGDGMDGTSANCAIDGDWVLTDSSGVTVGTNDNDKLRSRHKQLLPSLAM